MENSKIECGECRSGVVERIEGIQIWVRVNKSQCGTCSIAGQCLAAMDGGTDLIQTRAVVLVEVGQQVSLGTLAKSEIKIACTLYLLPAICLILGAALGQEVADLAGIDPTLPSAAMALGGAGLAWFPAWLLARRKDDFPVIIEVVQED
jgi:positive regulator of sigma E activity